MRRSLLTLAFIAFSVTPALAQLTRTDIAPGDTCTAGQTNMVTLTADADGDGRGVVLICNGANWLVERPTFSGTCNDGDAVMFDASTGGFTCTVPLVNECPDITPDPFNFADDPNASISTITESNILQITGIACETGASITGEGAPQLRVCSDSSCAGIIQDWINGPIAVNNNEYVQARMTSSATGGDPHQAIITVGTLSDGWTVTSQGDCAVADPTPGTVCADGTIYVGRTPDGNTKMYTTRCVVGRTWDGTACTGSSSARPWNAGNTDGRVPTATTSNATGKLNTEILVNADSDSSVAGLQSHLAATECSNLTLHGHSNWYLPALDEFELIENIFSLITDPYYNSWSSSEANFNESHYRYSYGWRTRWKAATGNLRCVRNEGPAVASICYPVPFAFTNLLNQALSSTLNSNIIMISGFTCASAPISISGDVTAEYRTCSDALCSTIVQNWTSSSGTISNGNYVQLRLTSAATNETTRSATVDIGGVTSSWDVATAGDCSSADPPVGTVCADGTVYAGLSSDGNVKMYTTRCDEGQIWSGTECTGSATTVPWNNNNTAGRVFIGATSTTSGESNATALDGVDSDSETSGIQPHQAAQACADKVEHGHSDWYLPTTAELGSICTNQDNFHGLGGTYWTSRESDADHAYRISFTFCDWLWNGDKWDGNQLRCVRR